MILVPSYHHWRPTKIRSLVQALPSGSEALQVETDVGLAFAKLPGGKEGPHILACELVGTRLAVLLELPVLDWVLMPYSGQPPLRLKSGNMAQAGTAWLTRKVNDEVIQDIVTSIPPDWEVDRAIQAAMGDFLRQRRDWLARIFVNRLFPQDELDLD